jgi:hypothetical protein
MAPFRILSLDGGGCRVVIEALMLERLMMDHPTLLDEVDLIAGASAGGIFALGLAAGFSFSEASKIYQDDDMLKQVFYKSWMREFESLDSAIGAAYSNEHLKDLLTKQFGTMTLQDLKKKVLVPSFQLDNYTTDSSLGTQKCTDAQGLASKYNRRWIPRFFHNLHDSPCNNELVVDVALRTSAAPTYFPIYQGYVDGGVFANNPSLCAVTTAIAAGIKLEDICVLSLSSGRDGLFVPQTKYGDGDWGLAQWAPQLSDMLLDAGIEVTDFQCAQLLGAHYHRVDPPLPGPVALDEPDKLPLLTQLAQSVDLAPTQQWLKEYWKAGEASFPITTTTPTTTPGVSPSKLNPTPSQSWRGWCVVQ